MEAIGARSRTSRFLGKGALIVAVTLATAEGAGAASAMIRVTSPAYCSEVKGDTLVKISAPGFKSVAAKCWKQGEGFGADSVVAEIALDARGEGSFVFPADEYPHGPVTVRILGQEGALKDNCYLQLYNRGGVSWKEGMPKDPPPQAKGLGLIFADDFSGPLSISSSDPKATYYDHKPPDGSQDFSQHTFSGYESPKNPFAQMDTYLRIRASDRLRSSGIISSLKWDGSGVTAKAPCYFECRFIGPNAPGTWPAFWLLLASHVNGGCDELDIIEAYGGEGPGRPNAYDAYMICPHAWNQGPEGKALEKKAFDALKNPIRMRKFGIPSAWYEAPHIYGCKITETETIYYCDDIEVGRHETLPLSRRHPHFFMVNLATGGGWPVDLSRYGGLADMYVDYVRVWAGQVGRPGIEPDDGVLLGGKPVDVTLRCMPADAQVRYTTDGSDPTPSSTAYRRPFKVRAPCTVKARAFKEGLEPSEVASVEFKKVELRKADAPPDCAPGLAYKYYEGQWEKLPDFDALTPVATGVVETITLAPRKRDDRFGLVFSGYIQAPADGMYTFCTVSDDGSQLLIGDTVVVDNDGAHGARARTGRIALAAGKHAITVRFFEWAGGEELAVSWSGPGFAREPLPAKALFH